MTGSAHSGSGGHPRGKTAASLLSVPIFKEVKARRVTPPEAESPPPDSSAVHGEAQAPSVLEPSLPEEAPEFEASQAVEGSPEPSGNEFIAPPKPREEPRYRNLPHYWRRLGRGGHPDVEDLDDRVIAENWPYTLLIRVPNHGSPLDIVRTFSSAGGNGSGEGHPLAGDRYSQLSSWLLELAREVAEAGRPVETVETFSLDRGAASFAVRVLPCGSRVDADASYVLLNVSEI